MWRARTGDTTSTRDCMITAALRATAAARSRLARPKADKRPYRKATPKNESPMRCAAAVCVSAAGDPRHLHQDTRQQSQYSPRLTATIVFFLRHF